MKKLASIVVLILLGSNSAVAESQETYRDIDQKMIEVLELNPDQASAYLAIIQKQRPAFIALKEQQWEQEPALYRETFAMLKPVLSEKQLAEFIAVINSVIEYTGEEPFLVVGN